MTSFSSTLLLTASVALLSACAAQTPTTATGTATPPAAIQPPPTTTMAAAPATAPSLSMPATTTTPGITDAQAAIYTRLSRLESDVGGLKNQMSELTSILEKMPALGTRIDDLMQELRRIDARIATTSQNTTPAPTAQKQPIAAKPATPAQKPMTPNAATPTPVAKPAVPQAMTSETLLSVTSNKPVAPATLPAASVRDVRIGDDADKTRIVFDLSRKVGFVTDLDNAEKILIVDVDAGEFTAPAGASFAKSPLVASYTAQALSGAKSRVILQLREAVDIARTQMLPPNGEKGDRIVLDLVKTRP